MDRWSINFGPSEFKVTSNMQKITLPSVILKFHHFGNFLLKKQRFSKLPAVSGFFEIYIKNPDTAGNFDFLMLVFSKSCTMTYQKCSKNTNLVVRNLWTPPP